MITNRSAALRLAAACAAVLLPLAGAGTAAAAPRAVTVARPSPPTGGWHLQTYPGITQAQALADWQPAVGGDTPLTGSGIAWQDDARLLGGQTVAFDGASSYLTASPTTLNTAGTFSLAAWVRLTDTSASRVFVSKAGSGQATLSVGYDRATGRWQAQMPSKTGRGGKVSTARSTSVPKTGLWTHLAVVHDATAHTLTLWVDGVAEATVAKVKAVNDPTGVMRVGRGDTAWWQGNLAEMRVYDRTLVSQDFTGWSADDPASGGFSEPGLVQPVQVGRWDFEAAVVCYDVTIDDPTLCSAPDGTPFDRQLTLTQGVDVVAGHRGSALALDDTHWIDDPYDPHYGESTREYARTQAKLGDWPDQVWRDAPVLRTDQSFSVSTWVRLDPARGAQTVLSQDSADGNAFRLAWEPVDGGRWVFAVPADPAAPAKASTTYVTAPAPSADQWHQLAAVLDATHRQARLYVDGAPAGAADLNAAWQPRQADGPLLVGRVTFAAGPAEWLYGLVDDLGAYQGALSAADVQAVFANQRV
ncbi:LamG domain-containing protein [Micromonospora sp. NPDC048999]|uniref:LamG domain-containing protein n=1 Tax=Micromonospora sp. NPDC048999 TaxID=3155391 RepID=UPI0033D74F9E